jgi:PAS domain S-box-containing protein
MSDSVLPDLDPRLILKHIEDGLLIVDTEGRILFTNEAFREMVGRPGEDLAGRMCRELGVGAFCDEHCPVTNGKDGTCAAAGATLHVRIGEDGGKGRPGAYCVAVSPVRDDEGKVLGWFENFRGMDRAIDTIRRVEPERGEAARIVRALELHRWSVGRTARALGVSRTTLWRRMRHFGIDRDA